jgi:glycosyltransferase involved in cell wall biosynthesis
VTTPLILVSNRIPKTHPTDAPRMDYVEITQALSGSLMGYNLSEGAWYGKVRQIETRLKLDLVEAIAAARRAKNHDIIVSLSEKLAIPLAVLLQTRKPHVVIGHKLSSGLKTRVFNTWKLHQRFDHLICVSRAQSKYAIHHLGMSPDRVHFVYDKVDHQFFCPQPDVPEGDYILAVGQEQRDYQTLLRAVAGTGLKLIVVASSPWSTSEINLAGDVHAEVRSRIPYTELRALYAGARIVVVPLFDVDYAAGVNAALEAMAMGKPLIISKTVGIEDYIVPRETGLYAIPGSADDLRSTIQSLWETPDERQRLGANARRAVEGGMNLDHYVQRVAEIVRSAY